MMVAWSFSATANNRRQTHISSKQKNLRALNNHSRIYSIICSSILNKVATIGRIERRLRIKSNKTQSAHRIPFIHHHIIKSIH